MHAAVADSRGGRSQRLRLLDGGLGRAAAGAALGLVDRPGARKIHEKPMPTSGGLAIWLGLVVPLGLGQCLLGMLLAARRCRLPRGPRAPPLLEFLAATGIAAHLPGLWQQSAKLWLLLGGGTVLDAPGAGRRSPRARLAVPPGGANGRGGGDGRLRVVRPLACPGTCAAGLAFAVSVVWIVGLVNSFNMLDNMDGLSAGVAAIAAAILAAAALLTPRPDNHQPQLFVAGFLLLIVGSLAGISLAQSAAGPAVHGRCRQLPGRLPAGDGHAHGDLCRRRSAATGKRYAGPWPRCA